MGLKILFIIIIFGIVIAGIYYMSNLGKVHTQCPDGSRYARAISGGWADTDPADPWGKCIPESQINSQYGQ